MNLICLFVAVILTSLNEANTIRYDGYHLLRVFPTQPEHAKMLEKFEENDNNFDIWNSARGPIESFDVLISPNSLLKYKKIFDMNKIKFEIVVKNIQDQIDEQKMSMLKSKANPSIINRYSRYTDIMSFIDDTVNNNNDIASSYIAGNSVENRLLKVIVLKPFKTSSKSLWIDCGIHAREWVSPATCVYIIDKLISEFRANDLKTVAIFQKYEIHIMPLVNPDGYEYSHTTQRLWRKNRKANIGSSCAGVDLNRNFGYKWLTGGSSTSPCSETFAGPYADSEPEVKAIESSLQKKSGDWDVYLNLHSYGNWWLLPFGYQYSSIIKPSNYEEMKSKGNIGVAAIKAVNGEKFVIGASSDLLYINSGSSKDWAYGVMNISYSYVLELRPGSSSPDYFYGFTLPENRMPLVSSETYAGIKEVFYSIVN